MKWEAEIDGKIQGGIEEEASWFLVDQRGGFYDSGPTRPPRSCDEKYRKLVPLIKIKNEYLSVDEIERRMDDPGKFNKRNRRRNQRKKLKK